MNVRRLLRIGAIATWGLALAPMAGTFGAETTAPKLDAQGWWNRSQALPVQGNPSGLDDPTGQGLTTAPTVPAPPTVPEDGLYVSNAADGPSAVAAVRYLVGGGGGTLTLQLAEGTTLTGTEELAGCPVQGGFTPAQNGRWDSIPGYDPATCTLAGTPSEDGTSFSFDVPSTFASSLGDVSVVIVPKPDSTTPFSLPFAKPTDGAFVVTSPGSSSDSTSSFSPGSSSFSPGSATFSAPSGSTSFAAPAAPSVTPTGGSDEVAAAPTVPGNVEPAVALAEPSRTSQVVAVLLLVAIGAAMWWLSRTPQRLPRLLGSVGGAAPADVSAAAAIARSERPRGVGRFARHRDVPATPL
jgi:hypothetical protein